MPQQVNQINLLVSVGNSSKQMQQTSCSSFCRCGNGDETVDCFFVALVSLFLWWCRRSGRCCLFLVVVTRVLFCRFLLHQSTMFLLMCAPMCSLARRIAILNTVAFATVQWVVVCLWCVASSTAMRGSCSGGGESR